MQEQSIPALVKGQDLLVQARTGTGKTAAFALPALSHIDVELRKPQILVIAPTRELAIQVAEAFCDYAKNMKGISIVPIYGGQDYTTQRKALKNGAHVIVATLLTILNVFSVKFLSHIKQRCFPQRCRNRSKK